MRISLVAACLLLTACADGWTNWSPYPISKNHGSGSSTTAQPKTEEQKRNEYYTSIDGYDVYVNTSNEVPTGTYRSRATFARYMGEINYDAGYPALIQAAETVALQKCANGYQTISQTGRRPSPNAALALYNYALTSQCNA